MAAEDTGPAIVNDHPFTPRGEWYTTCVCGLAEAAHTNSSIEHPPVDDRRRGEEPA